MKSTETCSGYESKSRNSGRSIAGSRDEEVYNKKRLHSGLDYCPPDEYEEKINQGAGRIKLKL